MKTNENSTFLRSLISSRTFVIDWNAIEEPRKAAKAGAEGYFEALAKSRGLHTLATVKRENDVFSSELRNAPTVSV